MIEFIYGLINSYDLPILTAFLLGVLTSLSPCPLATNLAAVAFISREIKTARNTCLNGLAYTLGRGTSYTILATAIYLGFSSFEIASFFQSWGDKILGPLLILISLVMFGILKINLGAGGERMERIKQSLARKGYLGAFLLGMILALAFCPYSGVLFFAILVPLVLKSEEGLMLPPFFALGTGLPVVILSLLIAISFRKLGNILKAMQKLEKAMRYGTATIFLLIGLYYMQFLIKYL